MKKVFTLMIVLGAYGFGYGQSMNTQATILLPNIVSEIPDEPMVVFAEFKDVDEEITIDMLFDKMAEIEAAMFTPQAIDAANKEHIIEDAEVVYF